MSKKKQTAFKMPYVGVSNERKYPLLFNEQGDYSVILRMHNPILQYDANPKAYEEFHRIFSGIIRMLGAGYVIQKQDVFTKKTYQPKQQEAYLAQKYQAHFAGRSFTEITTYLVVTRKIKKGRFYVFSEKQVQDFILSISKLLDLLEGAKLVPVVLSEQEINHYVMRILSMGFSSKYITLDSILAGDKELCIGDKRVRNIPLVNIDEVDMPNKIGPYTERNDIGVGFPVCNLSFLLSVPSYQSLLYNQVIEIPDQRSITAKLEVKKKRHSGIPDPANVICVEDIEQLLVDVARDGQLLVHAHYNIVLMSDAANIDTATNYIEAELSKQGITPSKNAYNQLELFRTVLTGNTVELKTYDRFLTTSDAAICLFFKEKLCIDEESDFQIRFTDRQGIPVVMDPADLPMSTGRITNRNKFVLGPSGSGKSFFMNSLVEQYCQYNMDVVLVDTGNSYSGLCTYYKGKYITYTEQKPITMNPFNIEESELNIEKKNFIKTLIGLLWKGAEGTISQIEDTVLSNVVSGYYNAVFLDKTIPTLNFNSFYDYALQKIKSIQDEEMIRFDLDEFRYVLKKFYKGGEFEPILNEAADASLFAEPFIVFEIDSIKEHKVLFPIVTLIIMDVFIQKMRNRAGRRKALIIEEAWKAIASKLMGEYIVYLYKTVRKFWGEAVVVTQELGDIIGNAIVKDSIINNSNTICLLDQSQFKENYDEVAKLLSLTEMEKNKIFTINKLDNKANRARFNEVYIKRGASGEVYGVEVSIYQYLTYTTEQSEKAALTVYLNTHPDSFETGLDAFVKDFQESKLSMKHFAQRINDAGKPVAINLPLEKV